MRHRLWGWIGAALIPLLILSSCVQPPIQPPPPETLQALTIDCRLVGADEEVGYWEAGAYELIEGECFVDNQIILSGNPSGIETTIFALEESGVVFSEARRLGENEPIQASLNDGPWEFWRLTAENASTSAIMEQFNALDAPLKEGVIADLNYVIGSADSTCSVLADPYSIGAHPYSIGAHPYSIGAHTSGPSGGTPLTPTDFLTQWALGVAPWGIGLVEERAGGQIARTTDEIGSETQVIIFDTSPFPAAGAYAVTLEVADGPPVLNLTVHHPADFQTINAPPHLRTDIRDHGLFAASLVHAVAPGSSIELVRVLNETGHGDLATLLSAIVDYAGGRDLSRTVINLSLGIAAPCAVLSLEQMEDRLLVLQQSGFQLDELRQDPIISLEVAMQYLAQQGASLVAAAGNNSADSPTPLPSHLPAAYPSVLSVMASGPDGEVACYSNWGNVAAPGGNPALVAAGCSPSALQLCEGPSCAASVIGAARTESGYQVDHWLGTSFATPLVAGICALMIAQERPACAPASVAEFSCPTTASIPIANVGMALTGDVHACP